MAYIHILFRRVEADLGPHIYLVRTSNYFSSFALHARVHGYRLPVSLGLHS